METVKGYKAFEYDWTCRGKKYTCPGTFEDCAPEDLKICSRGIHFCESLIDCFEFYNFSEQTKIAEVESLGRTLSDGKKTCTNKIRIIREVPWDEVLRLANTGKDNSGNWNSGDWNSGNWNSGCFNTETPKILLFNKPSEWTIYDWENSVASDVMSGAPADEKWILYSDMTDKEKSAHPEAKTQQGYLRSLDYEGLVTERNKWWRGLSDEDRQAVLDLPNFDEEIFYKCTLIKVGEEKK